MVIVVVVVVVVTIFYLFIGTLETDNNYYVYISVIPIRKKKM